MTNPVYIIYTDGGSRGNPGPSASGYVITGPGVGTVEDGQYLGSTTNNVAEYTAVILALERLGELLGPKKMPLAHVQVHADSELLVKQMNGQYRVKNAQLAQLYEGVHALKRGFGQVTFTHVRREHNKHADRMVNVMLDKQAEAEKMA